MCSGAMAAKMLCSCYYNVCMYILMEVLWEGGAVKIFEIQRGLRQKLFVLRGVTMKGFRIFFPILTLAPCL